MEYPSLKTFATSSSTFILLTPSLGSLTLNIPSLGSLTLNIPSLGSLTLNIPPLVYEPHRKNIYTFTKDRRISLMSEHTIRTQDN